MLKFKGIESESAANGIKALELADKTSDFDLIISDYNMPYMNGLEVIEKIGELFKKRGVRPPVILLYSSSEGEEITDGCKKMGIEAKLVKPVKMLELFALLDTLEARGAGSVESQKPAHEKPAVNTRPSAVGYSILVAEDNEINIMLARAIIAAVLPGISIIEARDGVQAVTLFKEFSPDLVLMDIQMPEKDGYAAAGEIRKLEAAARADARRSILIALTGGTVVGEKQRCLAAGFDDYIAKPVVAEKIAEVFNKWLSVKERPLNSNKGDDDNPPPRLCHFNYNELSARLSNDDALLKNIMKSAVANIDENIAVIEKKIAVNDPTACKAAAHSLKGAALNLCLDRLAGTAEKIEKNEFIDANRTTLIVMELKNEFEYIKKELDELGLLK